MSNYAATINAAPAYVVNDIYKRFINPNAEPKQYVRLSYIVSVVFVILGFAFGFIVESINQVTAVDCERPLGRVHGRQCPEMVLVAPERLRLFLGDGDRDCGINGDSAAFPTVAALYAFPYILAISLIGCIVGSYLTDPEPDEVLMEFYMQVRPWGFWKPILQKVRLQYPDFVPNRYFKRDMFNVVVGIVWQTSLVALPIFIVIHETTSTIVTLAITVITTTTLKFTWWNKLDELTRTYEPERSIGATQEKPVVSPGGKE